MENNTLSILETLESILELRKSENSKTSYVASLYAKGTDKICGKMAEECMETGLAAKIGDREQIVYEMADLWFHSMVLLSHHDIHHHEVLNELARRFGVSGHVEKANRTV